MDRFTRETGINGIEGGKGKEKVDEK